MSALRNGWVVWLVAGSSACARMGPSAAPLSAAAPSEPAATSPPVEGAQPSAPPEGAKLPGRLPGKLDRRALYQRSCELGSAVGCNDLAILLSKDAAESNALLERSCSLGLARGCANLAVQLLRGGEAEQKFDHAVELLSGACEKSDDYACAELGDALYEGRARTADTTLGRAYAAYERACQLGRMDACSSEGWMFRNGEGTAKNVGRARELFRFACERKSYAGCAALGYDLMDDAKNGEEQAEGARFLKLACEHDEPFGCFSLGAALVGGGEPKNLDGGLALLKRACTLGSPQACEYAAFVEARLKHGQNPGAAGDEELGEDEE